jgi:N1221-like protein
MEESEAPQQPAVGRPLVVKADEVDEVGTTIQSPTRQLPLSALPQRDGAASGTNRTVQAKTLRPPLRRDVSAPPPPSQPPPPAPPQQQNFEAPDTPTDSLSLPQLKQLVSQFPKVEQRAYAYQYADAQSYAEEIEEWFQYSEQDGLMILTAKETFEEKWRDFSESRPNATEEETSWINVSDDMRRTVVISVLSTLDYADRLMRIESIEVIFYILAGAWAITAGLKKEDASERGSSSEHEDHENNSVQREWMQKGADLLLECDGLQRLLDCTKLAFDDDAK